MKLETKPKNIAHMENMGTAKEFTMKATAKSFEILSSSLYSNPIRAIVRELSTNAYDSHIEAKNTNPFDVHLPTSFEPFFYIRDYGVGLSAEQVENIYITYFDSNKTESNDLVGGLGLGSKSPFSYTQNFTITAIKNGIKSLFSAFINDDGIPAIVKMGEVSSNEPSGVEIKFAVDKDFYKFEDEARNVYKYFSMKPNFVGKKIDIATIEFDSKDVVPNLHILKSNSYRTNAVVLMGNIPYPIDVPNADKVLGPLKVYQEYAIMIEFPIGEVQFQASREGLHYTKNTIQAIGRKFKELDDSLYSAFKSEMDSIDNVWERSVAFNEKQTSNRIWYNPANRYLKDFPENIIDDIEFNEKTYKKFNLKIEVFEYDSWSQSTKTRKSYIKIHPTNCIFIHNDTKVGIVNRLKHHLKTTRCSKRHYAIIPLDKSKNVDYNGFYNEIKNPPEMCKMLASSLVEMPKKERKYSGTKNIGVMKVVLADSVSYDISRRYKWESIMIDTMDQSVTYYYLPLNGYTPQYQKLTGIVGDAKQLYQYMRESTIPGISNINLYGVRKSDIEKIKDLKNWVNLETHIYEVLGNLTSDLLLPNVIYKHYSGAGFVYQEGISKLVKSNDSKYHQVVNYLKNKNTTFDETKAKRFVRNVRSDLDITNLVTEAEDKATKLLNTYPLLKYIKTYVTNSQDIIDYVNFIDMKKE